MSEFAKPDPIEESKIDSIARARKEIEALQTMFLTSLWRFEKMTGLEVDDLHLIRKQQKLGEHSRIGSVIIRVTI